MVKVRRWACCIASFVGALGAALPANSQTSPAPYLSGYRYQAGGLLVGTISPAPSGQSNFLATRNTYDGNQRLVKVETGVLGSWVGDTVPPSNWTQYTSFTISKTVSYGYDANGRKVTETVTGNDGVVTNVTQFSYDPYDRLTCTAIRMNPATFGSLPDACTLTTSGPYGADRITKNVYDSLNRVTQVQKALGTSQQQNYRTTIYTADSLPQYVSDANGNESYLTYDGLDRLWYAYFPSPTSPGSYNSADYEQYGYDPNGNRTSVRKRNGQVITYTPDALNRVSQKTEPAPGASVTYGYDLRGLQTSALFSSSGLGITNSYDGFGRLHSTTNTMSGTALTIGHGYDADGDRTSVTHPDGANFIYGYDGRDRFTGILENGTTTVVSQNYYPNALRPDLTLRSGLTRGGVSTSYGYDDVGRPQSWSDTFAVTGPNLTTSLAYNPAEQITSRTRSNDAYAYSGFANGSTAYSSNGLNQYSSVAGSSFSYDPNGNLTSDGQTSYAYDEENRLLTASGAYNATLTYDPLGRLFQIVSGGATTQFLYDGDELIAEYNGSGTLLRRYAHGPAQDDPMIWYEGAAVSAATRRSLQANYQGSIESVADASGNPIILDRYDDYGVPATSNIGRFQYTGQAWIPEVGLYYYKGRVYSPRLGRFMQTDPVGYEDDLDLYSYVGNDPLNMQDVSGQFALPVHFLITLAAGLSSGHSWHSFQIAWKAMMRDIGTQHATTDEVAIHAMRVPAQSVDAARRNTLALIASERAQGHLGNAAHTVQDQFPYAHEGYQKWDGTYGGFKNFLIHEFTDLFPTPERVRAAYDATRDMMTGVQDESEGASPAPEPGPADLQRQGDSSTSNQGAQQDQGRDSWGFSPNVIVCWGPCGWSN